MNPETLRKIFKSPFDYKTYSNEIVHRVFGCNDVASRPELLDTNAEGDKSHFIGQMEDADSRLLGFFYTRVADGGDVRRKRVGLRKLISPYLKYDVDGAIAIFDDGHHWRLSYICDLKEGSTSAKRFSYILGDEQGQYKTPIERLEKIAELKGRFKLADLREAFSVDALSKEFFDEYHRHYDIIVGELKHQKHEGATIHDYVKKMMGRIVFLHFLQKKGWLNNNPAFLRDLFFFSPHQGDFLEQVLEPLFFGIFNTEKGNRQQLFKYKKWDISLLEDWKELPYLNGGLFERDSIDELNITLPASLFEDLFNFMASYNFTVDENDPDDAEIGVDPEMLGKIFESLLVDNKAKGAFYTPKEIVRYMCKESLIAYLSSKLPDANDGIIRTFVETHEMLPELEPYRDTLKSALREVKICDPAIGSGAFPMGLLNELWRCREAIEETASRVELKKEIIENNIYGVDIEKGAIDIARLRFWLSIVVDAEKPEPLPNFDYKFMQGNSLIESFNGHDLSHIMDKEVNINGKVVYQRRIGGKETVQVSMDFTSDDTRKNLQIWLKRYFSLTDHREKSEYRQRINDSVKNYIRQKGIDTATEAYLNALDPSANQDFFLWHTWFKDIFDKGGFDIVIGNPPYIQLQSEGGLLADLYQELKYKTFTRAGDIYTLFYERGWSIIKNSGHCCLITSNKWMRTDYGRLTRDFLSQNTNPKILIDFGGVQIFESATVDTNILLFEKGKNTLQTHCAIANNSNKEQVKDLSHFMSTTKNKIGFSGSDSWVILSQIEKSIKEKIRTTGKPLRDWNIQINYGIKTGLNETFVINTEQRNNILQRCKDSFERERTEALIVPILRGRDVKKNDFSWAGMWLINTHNGVKGRLSPIEIKEYPAVKEYLDNFKEKLCKREDQGNTPYNLRNCAYLEDFSKTKIVWARLMRMSKKNIDDFPRFCIVPKEYYIVDSLCFFTGEGLDLILAVLNSEFASWYFFNSVATLDNGGFQMRQQYVEHIPIPLKIQGDVTDETIYKAFEFTDDEVKYIKKSIIDRKLEILDGNH